MAGMMALLILAVEINPQRILLIMLCSFRADLPGFPSPLCCGGLRENLEGLLEVAVVASFDEDVFAFVAAVVDMVRRRGESPGVEGEDLRCDWYKVNYY